MTKRNPLAVLGSLLVCALLTLSAALPAGASDLAEPVAPPHLLFDLETGEVLDAHRMDQRWAPASLTKMMTAYTVFRALELQHLKLDSPVGISEYALSQPPSKMGFPIGTVLTIEAALKIIMVKSANDVSVALAEGVAGSEEQFVALMNAHARRLGMVDSQFVNPHGLHDPEQYTSARDIALLTKALENEFSQHASFFDIPAIRVGNRRLRNHNALLRLFRGTSGYKTGYVCASGYNVVVATKRNERRLGVVVFGGKSGLARNVKAARLLSAGFDAELENEGSKETLVSPRTRPLGGFAEDITREICPVKYAALAKPETRPPEAPSAQDFDGIDTQVIIDRETAKEVEALAIAVPTPRPEYQPVAESESEVKTSENTEGEAGTPVVEAERPPTLRELAKQYFEPVTDLREDETVQLAGAFGPNPFGIKTTNGGVYVPPIPVPEPRPRLDLAKTGE